MNTLNNNDPPARKLRIGSLFSGYMGLDMAAESVFDAETVWVSDVNPGANLILAHRTSAPNLGDLTVVDWASVEPVDVIAGGFPCFQAGTLITTATGPVPIENVKRGDAVLSHERRWRTVVQTMARVADHQVIVKAMGTPSILTTDEHPFYVKRTATSAAEWVPAKGLARGMFLAQPVDVPSDEPVTAGMIAEWYLIGRWLGDGWTVIHKQTSTISQGHSGSRVHWCCSPAETDELEKAFASAGLTPTRSDERTVTKYVMQSAHWAHRLADFGRYAHGKRIPEHVHTLPRSLQQALLAGWLDADGDVKADGAINGTTVSKALALGMARVARLVHGKPVSIHEVVPPSSTRIEGRLVQQRPYWNVRIAAGSPRQAFTADKFIWVPVRTITRTADIERRVYNLGVAEDESYVADSVVVHNCQDLSAAGKRAGMHEGTRSGLWAHMAKAIEIIRPRFVIAENVRGLLSATATSNLEPCPWCVGDSPDGQSSLRALGCVLGDLAELGYDAQWVGLRAADVGAPHGRFRIFVLATRGDLTANPGGERHAGDGGRWAEVEGLRLADEGHRYSVADPKRFGLEAGRRPGGREAELPGADNCVGAVPNPNSGGWRTVGDGGGTSGERLWPAYEGRQVSASNADDVGCHSADEPEPGKLAVAAEKRGALAADPADVGQRRTEEPEQGRSGVATAERSGLAANPEGVEGCVEYGNDVRADGLAQGGDAVPDTFGGERTAGGSVGGGVSGGESSENGSRYWPADVSSSDPRQPGERERVGGPVPDSDGERHGGGEDSRGVGRLDGEDAGRARQRERARAVVRDRSVEVAADPEGARLGAGRVRVGAAADGAATGDDDAGLAGAATVRDPGHNAGSAEHAVEREQQGDARAGQPGHGVEWGPYTFAVRQWESVLGRLAPPPTEVSHVWLKHRAARFNSQNPKRGLAGRRGSLRRFLTPEQRLNPRFVEWMMGLPAGWVCDVPGLGRNAQLKALGNGVVPAQAEAALRYMLARIPPKGLES